MITPTDSTASLAIDTKSIESLKQSAKQNSPESLKAAAQQFEALFVNMMLKSMRDATPQEGLFDNQQTKMYQSMLDQQLGQNMASRGIGLADVLIRQLSINQGSDDGTNGSGGVQTGLSDMVRTDLLQSMAPRTVKPSPRTAEEAGAAITSSSSSRPAHVKAFQEKLTSHAEEASRTTGIPAEFMLGQAALESGWGKRMIRTTDGTNSHNLFGIKATASWKGKTVDAVTTEYVDGVPQKRVEKFRAYDSYADSFRDYANLLRNNPRYEKVIANASDVEGFAKGLQRAGYATDPNYAAKLTNIIKTNFSS
ncbi:MAG: flagellar assembly peptidoglycan hydrolase FlgJ [Oxalicibacterium faecigallinarum]|uniref:Peptidoglycan hydrolase FlgJ n=1 Tax=Oxalicibacterium faecigallinarum TaxID=573741 RepID=A0A8J3AM96_9BURK|nr:flagellar assembly peptidoglycan hydrolase FlgJ [Oxalicibacterium faecigallinarum]MDQ7969698.1 flagellar assembly peptidoglycan hydrolase FlgJ [Oxalicibacterium faecigallinarum]GGI16328.1 flagellar rod assembly protein/muramidase FlgJ [Oxalicibacterium faecigallinarum]